jgi:hypothetical protein
MSATKHIAQNAPWHRAATTLSVLLLVLGPWCVVTAGSAAANPPFSGTIFIDPDIVTASDLTTYQSAVSAGQGYRWMYDRRVNNWVYLNAYLVNASFDDGLSIEIQVNPEFGSAAEALAQAQTYAPAIGQLSTALRRDVQTVWIHRGLEPFGGGNNNLLIHTEQADAYVASGILEETLIHEASHTSLDADHAASQGWLAAQSADGEFISTYARDNPTREDIAESFLTWVAVRHRPDRISQQLYDTIIQTIPNRIAYFDSQSLDMYPITGGPPPPPTTVMPPSTTTTTPPSTTTTLPSWDGCPSVLQASCIPAGQARMQILEKAAGKEKMKLQWRRLGANATRAQFGNPVSGQTVAALCIYDQSGNLVQDFVIDRARQLCGSGRCWKASGAEGYAYKDKVLAADGISKLRFSGGSEKGKVDAAGRNKAAKGNASLPVGVAAGLAGSSSPTIQFVTSGGLCIGATMTSVQRDDGLNFQAVR